MLAAILFVATAFAAAPELPATNIQVECKTAMPSTTFIVDTEGSTVTATLINHNGPAFMPVHNGAVTMADLPRLAANAELLQKLGDKVTFRWPISACKQVEHKRFHCFGQGEVKYLGGVDVKGFAIDSGWSRHDNVGGVYEQMQITLSVIINGELYSAPMDYAGNECKLAL